MSPNFKPNTIPARQYLHSALRVDPTTLGIFVDKLNDEYEECDTNV